MIDLLVMSLMADGGLEQALESAFRKETLGIEVNNTFCNYCENLRKR